ncbi:hypothetical protein ABI59_08615 [Acidobacteria bacterium Mor1]|nr:hypothetical protein ABI59_08615 [Acidobacteria bacterium Mor1]
MRPPLDSDQIDRLFDAAYDELRRLAAQVGKHRAGATLNPTALVNEAYVRLRRLLRVEPASELHFRRIVAQAMRQVLVEAARRRQSQKRGGDTPFVTFDEERDTWTVACDSVIRLDEALDELSRLHPRQALLVECRFFGGLRGPEIATLLDVSLATVERDWRLARAWLSLRVRGEPAAE